MHTKSGVHRASGIRGLGQKMNALETLKAEYAAKSASIQNLRKVDLVQNEGGEGYSSYESASAALFAEYTPKIKALEDAAFAADWTLDALTARRAAWNAEIQKLIASKTAMTMAAIVAKVGFSLADLIRAKALHNIK